MTKVEEFYLKNGGYWGEHPDFPIKDWQHEVANDDTRCGYWEWVLAQIGEIEI